MNGLSGKLLPGVRGCHSLHSLLSCGKPRFAARLRERAFSQQIDFGRCVLHRNGSTHYNGASLIRIFVKGLNVYIFRKKPAHLLAMVACCACSGTWAQTITNPIASNGADPWIVKKGGMYVYCYSADDNSCIYVNTNSTIQAAAQFEGRPIRTPDSDTYYSKEPWAPELHFLQGKWRLYVAADDGNTYNHRMVVLESKSDDPFGPYTCHGKITDSTDKWAILISS